MRPPLELRQDVSLAPHTTLRVGGAARYFVSCNSGDELAEAAFWARGEGLEFFVLGGGSNLLVADRGFDGVVAQCTDASIELEREGLVRVGAAAPWDRVVERSVERGLAGIEALSGIPGSSGAAPIQNIGAYGQEIAETLEAVEAVDLESGDSVRFTREDCALGYRTSAFKTHWRGRYAVTGLTLKLSLGAPGSVRYRDLEQRFPPSGPLPSPAEVRDAVLEIRRKKSMLLLAGDPNRRSAGSFFVNPIVGQSRLEDVRRRVGARLGAEAADRMPAFEAPEGQTKLSAAWLVEGAGFRRGYTLGAAGLSSRHALALINRGEARAADLLALAGRIRRRVRGTFGITLEPEPTFLGFDRRISELLD